MHSVSVVNTHKHILNTWDGKSKYCIRGKKQIPMISRINNSTYESMHECIVPEQKRLYCKEENFSL